MLMYVRHSNEQICGINMVKQGGQNQGGWMHVHGVKIATSDMFMKWDQGRHHMLEEEACAWSYKPDK